MNPGIPLRAAVLAVLASLCVLLAGTTTATAAGPAVTPAAKAGTVSERFIRNGARARVRLRRVCHRGRGLGVVRRRTACRRLSRLNRLLIRARRSRAASRGGRAWGQGRGDERHRSHRSESEDPAPQPEGEPASEEPTSGEREGKGPAPEKPTPDEPPAEEPGEKPPPEEPGDEEPAPEGPGEEESAPEDPEGEEEPAPVPPGAAPSSIYWGAWIHDHLTGDQAPWDMSAVAAFEDMTEKPLSLVNFSAPFANCGGSDCYFYEFPRNEFNSIRSHGAIPFYSWASQSIPATTNQPEFQLSDTIEGRYDSYVRRFATAAREWGHPFFLRFNWEMNGNWFAWAEGANGNRKGEFVAAWRHVHDIFEEVGADNATWVWCPNVDPDGRFQDLEGLYPGDEYVDWTGLDGYNWGTNPAKPDRWRSFDQLYRSTYEEIVTEIAPGKPLVVSEVGSTEYGGSKSSWIRDMLRDVHTDYSAIRGLMYFEKYDDGMDWPLATSDSAAAAFAEGISHPAYAGNQFGSLGGDKVPTAG